MGVIGGLSELPFFLLDIELIEGDASRPLVRDVSRPLELPAAEVVIIPCLIAIMSGGFVSKCLSPIPNFGPAQLISEGLVLSNKKASRSSNSNSTVLTAYITTS